MPVRLARVEGGVSLFAANHHQRVPDAFEVYAKRLVAFSGTEGEQLAQIVSIGNHIVLWELHRARLDSGTELDGHDRLTNTLIQHISLM